MHASKFSLYTTIEQNEVVEKSLYLITQCIITSKGFHKQLQFSI